MARNFVSTDNILLSKGSSAGADANFSVIAVIKKPNNSPNSATRRILQGYSPTAGERIEFRLDPFTQAEDTLSIWSNNDAVPTFTVPDDVWCLVAVSKASGTTTPRFHMRRLDTNALSHGDGSQAISGLDMSVGDCRWEIGNASAGTTPLIGDIAWIAVFAKTISDAQFEAFTSLRDIFNFIPNRMWVLNQAAVTTSVVDSSGNSADQTGRTGTTVATGPGTPWDTYEPPLLTTDILDNFNRANVDPLDGNWIHILNADLKIVSNHLEVSNTGPASGIYEWGVSPTADDVVVWIGNILALPSTDEVEVMARAVNHGDSNYDCYGLSYNGNGNMYLGRRDAGNWTLLDSVASTFQANDGFALACIGSRIAGWRLRSGVWTEMLAVTDGTYAKGGKLWLGYYTDANGLQFDGFGGGGTADARAHEIFKRPGIFFYDLASNNANRETLLQWAKDADFGWAAVQCFNDADGGLQFQSYISTWLTAIRNHGMYAGLWGVQNNSPSNDASVADSQIDLWLPDFYIANAEQYYKTDSGGTRAHAATFCTAFRAAQPTIPAALVTYGTIASDTNTLGDALDTNAGVMDFKAWYDASFHILPEAYYGADTVDKPDRCVRHYRRAHWPYKRIHPVVGIYNGVTITGADYRPLLSQQDNTELEAAYRGDTPRGFWKMMDSSGTVKDGSGNGLDLATITGTPDYLQPGPWPASPCIKLNGGEFIDLSGPVSTKTNDFTIELLCWVQAIGQNLQEIIHNGTNTTDGWGIVVNVDRTWRSLAGNVGYGDLAKNLLPDRWVHIALVCNTIHDWSYYFEGELDTDIASSDTPNTPTGRFRLGAGSVQTAYSYVAVYETALSAAQIKAHREALMKMLPVCSPETAYGYSLFLGESAGSFGTITQQDYIDLGKATSLDKSAFRTYDDVGSYREGGTKVVT